jgi:hypothetical protein
MHAAVHCAVLLLATQVAPHRWKPALHAGTHAVPLHVTVPFAGARQLVHDAPQASVVSLATQVVPRRQKPGESQTIRQVRLPGTATLSHAAIPLAGGAGHAVHDAPHELKLVLATQVPVPAGQRWYPASQAMLHWLARQTAPACGSDGIGHVAHDAEVPHCMVLSSGKHPLVAGQVCVPEPQTTPQTPATHAVPSGQGVQSTPLRLPQVADAMLLTHWPLQRCQPVLHAWTHVPAALQDTVPLSAGGVQTVHVLPHELMLTLPLTTQVVDAPLPHTW